MPDLVPPPDPKDTILPDYNFGRGMGDWARGTGIMRPLGAFTGLPPQVGAPISGALIGLGAGALVSGGQSLLDTIRGEERPEVPWWQRPWAVGLGLGAGVGAVSGLAQASEGGSHLPLQRDDIQQRIDDQARINSQIKLPAKEKVAATSQEISRILIQDPSLNPYERDRIIDALHYANDSQLNRLLAAAASGALTAGAAYSILGVGGFGSAILGGIAAMVTGNMLPGETRYV